VGSRQSGLKHDCGLHNFQADKCEAATAPKSCAMPDQKISLIVNSALPRDNNHSDIRRVIFLQFSDNDHSSLSQIAALIGQTRRAADIGCIGEPASLAAAWQRLRSKANVSHR
jgi:hypothetical protein